MAMKGLLSYIFPKNKISQINLILVKKQISVGYMVNNIFIKKLEYFKWIRILLCTVQNLIFIYFTIGTNHFIEWLISKYTNTNVLYCTIVKIVSGKVGGPSFYVYTSWTSLVTLGSAGNNNHLWTVTLETKYYFFIPLFTGIIYKSRQRWFFFIDYGNLFNLSEDLTLLNV